MFEGTLGASLYVMSPALAPEAPPIGDKPIPEIGSIDAEQLERLHTLCVQALALNEAETQFKHLDEETAEYNLARSRLWRNRSTELDVLEEIVDVFMCTVQMGVHHYGADAFNEMLARKNDKFERNIIKGMIEPVGSAI